MTKKDEIKLIKIVADILDELSEEQLTAILEKKARLKFEFTTIQKTDDTVDELSDDFYTQFEMCQSRESAQRIFDTSNFQKSTLKSIAKHYSVPVGSKDRNQQIVSKIIETVIGSKIKYDTLLNTNLGGSK